MLRLRSLIAAGAVVLAIGSASFAAETPTPPAQKWSFEGLFGTYDRAALQRGFQIYKEVCSNCHAMNQLRYRDLGGGHGGGHGAPVVGLGFTDDEIKAIAAEYKVMDGPNDQGEMFERPARPSDRFKKPFANEQQARSINNGAYPPDLSLIAEARLGGPDYVYALLTGYKEPPAGMTMNEGMNYNEWFAGHQIAMAQPLNDDQVTYADGTKATISQMARDVTTFLVWAAEPNLEQRKALGLKVILFLILFSGILYAVKRKVWADLH